MTSVITITFNNFDELVQTLESLKNASNIHSVVVNGGTCEKTRQLLTHHNGTVINEKDDGISDAFNKGVRASPTQTIAFLNSGDILRDPHYYEIAEKTLAQNPSMAFAYSSLIFNDSDAGEITFTHSVPSLSNIGKGMPAAHPTLVVKKEVFSTAGYFDTKYRIAMDYEWMIRVLSKGLSGIYLEGKPVWMNGDGVSSTHEQKAFLECKQALIAHGLFFNAIKRDFQVRWLKFKIRVAIKKIFGPMAFKYLKRIKNR